MNATTDSTGPGWVDQTAAAQHLGLQNPRTLANWRLRRCGPPFVRLGQRLVRYRLADLDHWAESQRADRAQPASSVA